jgi:hypothetical protein
LERRASAAFHNSDSNPKFAEPLFFVALFLAISGFAFGQGLQKVIVELTSGTLGLIAWPPILELSFQGYQFTTFCR